jgi:hypothetical protein
MPPWPIIQLTEPKLMIEPPPAAFIIGCTAWAAKNWCLRFTAMRSSQYSGVTVSNLWRSSWAALLTSTVIGPCRSAAWRMARRSASISRRSHSMNKGSRSPAAATSVTSAALGSTAMSTNATLAPCAAKWRTSAAPMPLPPPVMNTERSCRLG